MNYRILIFPILALLLLATSGLQAQKAKTVRDGYEVKQITLNKKAAQQLKVSPLFTNVAVMKGTTVYPSRGYKIIALQNGRSAGIVPIHFQPGKETMGGFQKMTIKGILGGCFCPAGEGGCRLKAFVRDGKRDYNCIGRCDCGAGLLILDIGIKIAKKENMEGTNEWPAGNGSNFPHGF
jgi:hypothetical protein